MEHPPAQNGEIVSIAQCLACLMVKVESIGLRSMVLLNIPSNLIDIHFELLASIDSLVGVSRVGR